MIMITDNDWKCNSLDNCYYIASLINERLSFGAFEFLPNLSARAITLQWWTCHLIAFPPLFLLTEWLIWFHPPLCGIDFIDRCTWWQSIVCCEIIVPSLVLWWDFESSPYIYSLTIPARVTAKTAGEKKDIN